MVCTKGSCKPVDCLCADVQLDQTSPSPPTHRAAPCTGHDDHQSARGWVGLSLAQQHCAQGTRAGAPFHRLGSLPATHHARHRKWLAALLPELCQPIQPHQRPACHVRPVPNPQNSDLRSQGQGVSLLSCPHPRKPRHLGTARHLAPPPGWRGLTCLHLSPLPGTRRPGWPPAGLSTTQPEARKTHSPGLSAPSRHAQEPRAPSAPSADPSRARRRKKNPGPATYLKEPVAPPVEGGDDGGMDIAAVQALGREEKREFSWKEGRREGGDGAAEEEQAGPRPLQQAGDRVATRAPAPTRGQGQLGSLWITPAGHTEGQLAPYPRAWRFLSVRDSQGPGKGTHALAPRPRPFCGPGGSQGGGSTHTGSTPPAFPSPAAPADTGPVPMETGPGAPGLHFQSRGPFHTALPSVFE